MGMFDQADWGVFKRSETWKAFGIAVVLFGVIAFAGLSLFDSMDEIFESDAEPAPIPEIVIQSLNRTGIEENYTNSDGEIRLSEMRGDVIILDLMARDCGSCHYVQEHLENEMDGWKKPLKKTVWVSISSPTAHGMMKRSTISTLQ